MITLTPVELNALLDLARLAAPRLTLAESLFYNQLFERIIAELEKQDTKQTNNDQQTN